jgi:hypothetical protein
MAVSFKGRPLNSWRRDPQLFHDLQGLTAAEQFYALAS